MNRTNLSGRRIAVGVCGSIAAYKSAELVSKLVSHGANVRVAMTPCARKLLSERVFQTLSRNPVCADMWSEVGEWKPEHIAMADFAELFVVAPATANSIANFANGLAPDFVSCTFLACHAPILIAPAMNCNMWNNFAVERNVKFLMNNGIEFIGPEKGRLACGTEGLGRMSEPDAILSKIETILSR